jgi:putative flippase GtrA
LNCRIFCGIPRWLQCIPIPAFGTAGLPDQYGNWSNRNNVDVTRSSVQQFLKFVGVGGIVAVVHFSLLLVLVQSWRIDPVVASSIGFVASATLNYWLNYTFTFRSQARHGTAITKFFGIAVVGLSLNTALMSVGIELLDLNYIVTQIGAIVCVVFWNFFANRAWTFGSRSEADRS